MTTDDCGPLAILFPRNTTATDPLGDPNAVVVQALPTAIVILVWIALERHRAPFTRSAQLQGGLLGLVAATGLGILAWRIFDVLACEDVANAESWRMVAVMGAPVAGLALLLLGPRCARAGIVAALALAGGAVFADWAMRTWLPGTRATSPLAAVQHLWLLYAVVLISHLPSTRRGRTGPPALSLGTMKRTKTTGSALAAVGSTTVDPLARRTVVAEEEPDRSSWSWFL